MPQRFVRHPAYGYLPPGNHAVLLVKEIGQHCAVKLRGSCHARSVSARTDISRRALPEHPAQPQTSSRRRRTNPGPTPTQGGRTPDRHPPKADEPRTDTHPRRTNPGPTTMAVRSRESGHPAPPPQPPPHNGGRTPDRHPPKADETRIDHHAVGGGGVGTGGGGG